MRKEIREALAHPFDAGLIRTRKGRGSNQTFQYVRAQDYIDRLNCLPEGAGWELFIDEMQIINSTDIIVRGRLVIDGETRSDVGGATMTVTREGELISDVPTLAKKSVSDLLKRCARHFGLHVAEPLIHSQVAADSDGYAPQVASPRNGNGNGRCQDRCRMN